MHPLPPFSLAFLDPPYGRALAEAALDAARGGGWLTAGALAVVEEAADAAFAAPAGFDELERRRYDAGRSAPGRDGVDDLLAYPLLARNRRVHVPFVVLRPFARCDDNNELGQRSADGRLQPQVISHHSIGRHQSGDAYEN